MYHVDVSWPLNYQVDITVISGVANKVASHFEDLNSAKEYAKIQAQKALDECYSVALDFPDEKVQFLEPKVTFR